MEGKKRKEKRNEIKRGKEGELNEREQGSEEKKGGKNGREEKGW